MEAVYKWMRVATEASTLCLFSARPTTRQSSTKIFFKCLGVISALFKVKTISPLLLSIYDLIDRLPVKAISVIYFGICSTRALLWEEIKSLGTKTGICGISVVILSSIFCISTCSVGKTLLYLRPFIYHSDNVLVFFFC